MSTIVQASIKFPTFKSCSVRDDVHKKQTYSFSPLETRLASYHHSGFKLRAHGERWGILGEQREWKKKKKRRMVFVKNNQGFGFNGGGGGGRDDGATARLLGNIALAVGLTYLSMTGQLGWILDAIVSIWIFAVLIPIVGLGAFLWWAGRDIMQGTCPNCGSEFQVFKSSLNDDLQLCPFCGQPFSVVGNEFVKDSVKFSNQSTTFGQAFNDFTRSRNGFLSIVDNSLVGAIVSAVTGKDSGRAIDVEAEVKDAE